MQRPAIDRRYPFGYPDYVCILNWPKMTFRSLPWTDRDAYVTDSGESTELDSVGESESDEFTSTSPGCEPEQDETLCHSKSPVRFQDDLTNPPTDSSTDTLRGVG